MINLKKFLAPQDLYIDLFKNLIQNKGPFYLSLTILLLIIWQSSQLFWSIFPKKILPKVINIPSSMVLTNSNSEPAIQSNLLINNIVDQHLFGKHAEENKSEVTNNEPNASIISDLKETKLNLDSNEILNPRLNNSPGKKNNTSRKIIKPSDQEIKLHKEYLKSQLPKNYYN